MSHACQRFWNCYKTLTFCSLLARYRIPCAYHAKSHPETVSFYHLLTSTCASRHNGVQFFNISTPKSAPWLRNLLRAATACNFSSLIWPDGSAPAALASLLFDPPEPQDIGKNAVFRDFSTFRAPASSFFWLFLFSDLLSSSLLWLFPPLLFHLSILSEVWLLNFLHNIRYIYIHIGTITISGGRGDHRHWAIYVHICIYMCIYVYICAYIYTYIYTYIYIYTHQHIWCHRWIFLASWSTSPWSAPPRWWFSHRAMDHHRPPRRCSPWPKPAPDANPP